MRIHYSISVAVLAALVSLTSCSRTPDDFDLVVLGGSPGGVAAAVAGARQGLSVCLVADGEHVGGALSSGLGHVDEGRPELLGGIARETFYAVERHYRETYGPQSSQYADCAAGLRFEPRVIEAVFEEMLKKERVHVFRGLRFVDSEIAKNQIQSVRLIETASGGEVRLSGKIFVDASYGGDVYVEAGAPFRAGRESREVFGESLAGLIFQNPATGEILPASTGAGDSLIQASGYVLCLTDSAANQAAWPEPESYDPSRYSALIGYIRASGADEPGDLVRLTRLPNRKLCVESHPDCPVSTDLPGGMRDWISDEPGAREAAELAHMEHLLGLFRFLRTDPAVPANLREAFASLAPAADEFTGNSGLPSQLHVRESVRLDGRATFVQADALTDTHKVDAVCAGAFRLESAVVSGISVAGSRPEGCFSLEGRTYQVGYNLMLPAWLRNLAVPVTLSSSHAGWCGLNRESLFMQTGEAAGVAAAICIRYNCEVDEIPVSELQTLLRRNGAILSADEARPWEPSGGVK